MNRRDRRTRPEPQRPPLRKVKEERWSDKVGAWPVGVQCPGTRGGDARKTEEAVEASQLLQGTGRGD